MIIPTELYHLEEITSIENYAFDKPWTRNQIKYDIQSESDFENWVYIMNDFVAGYVLV